MTFQLKRRCELCGAEGDHTHVSSEFYADLHSAPETQRLVGAIDPNRPRWSFASALGLWVFFMIAPVILTGIVAVLYAQAKKISFDELSRGTDALIIGVSTLFLVHLLTLVIGWLIVTGGAKRPFFQSLGWQWHARFKVRHALGIVAIMYGLVFLLSFVIPSGETDFDRMLEASKAVRLGIVVLAIVTAPLVEELVYRGVLYPAFQVRAGRMRAVVVVALMFAVAHFTQYAGSWLILVAVTLLSFVITLIRSYTGQLLPCVVTHLVYNGVGAALILNGYGF
jgi:hypothetical protein